MRKLAQVKPSLAEVGIVTNMGQKNIKLPTGGTTGGMVTTGSHLSKIPLRTRYKGKGQEELENKFPSLAVVFKWRN
jgi:hypothetical protein